MTAIKSIIKKGSGGEGKGIYGILVWIPLVLVGLFGIAASAMSDEVSKSGLESGCWFLRDENPDAPVVSISSNLKSVRMADYFRIFYPSADPIFVDSNQDGIPEILQKNQKVIEQSRHLLQTELGWKTPVSKMEGNTPELSVYFVNAGKNFAATTRNKNAVEIFLNRSTLLSRDFPAIWIHQLTHAAELEYRKAGDYWFYEATAGWMEGQFYGLSRTARLARKQSMAHPEVPLTDSNPVAALGSARFVETLGRPYKDVVRQIWEGWSYSKEDTLIQIIQKVLELNHLAGFESHLQNYFLLSIGGVRLERDSQEINLPPFSAVMYTGQAEQPQGGLRLGFVPEDGASYSTSVLFFASGEKSGTLAMEPHLQKSWNVLVPFADLDHYSAVIVNHSASELRGRIQKSFDPGIPAIVEYFRVNPEENGVQIEWKTARENGVAFWNLYRVQNGQKVRLNDFPIPAAIHSDEGIHYLYLDSTGGNYYTLEAITQEGFQSRCAGSQSPQQ